MKRVLLSAGLVCWASSSYSEDLTPYFGTTGNAASAGHQWVMDNILPTPPGLDINGVFYSYTPNKETDADMKVHVGNQKADGTGYVFRETDDWSGVQGGIEIRKVIGLANIPREAWGNGSIEVEGDGTVEDATVIYSYKVDPCYNPQFDPMCPGYKVPVPPITVTIEIYDATEDEYANLNNEQRSLIDENEETLEDIDQEEEEAEEEAKRKYRLEQMMAAGEAAAYFAENQIIEQMNNATQIAVNDSYLNATIDGGAYQEDVVLVDNIINDNKQALRNGLAQQLLHEQMVQMQYDN